MNQLIVNIHTMEISPGNHETWCSIVERISGSDVTGMMVRIRDEFFPNGRKFQRFFRVNNIYVQNQHIGGRRKG